MKRFLRPLFLMSGLLISAHSAEVSDTGKYGDADTHFGASPLLGVTLDWRFAGTGGHPIRPRESGSWTVRTDFSLVSLQHGAYDREFGGFLLMIKVGVGGIGWPIVRDGLPRKGRRNP